MNVLIVSFYYSPELGAAPSRITNLAHGLRDCGVGVDLLTCMPNYPKGEIFDGYKGRFSMTEKKDGITIHRYWTYATTSKSSIRRLWGMTSFALAIWAFAFRRKRILSYDRVIIQSPPLLVAYSAMILFKCLYGKTTILNVSDLWPDSAVELGAMKEYGIIYRVMAYMERFIYKNANAVMGQSKVILEHITSFQPGKKTFLYRNLQPNKAQIVRDKKRGCPLKIVYAGLMGVAQDILGLLNAVDFASLNAELHLYGGGNQLESIKEFIKNNDGCNVCYHGFLPKEEMAKELANYDASIVPLVVSIKGAVPSKIFDLLPVGIPILFCGSGEGAKIIDTYKLGLTSPSKEYGELATNILNLMEMTDAEYDALVQNCIDASKKDFCFDKQMELFLNFIKSVQ